MATQTKPSASVHTRSRRKLNFGESQRFKGKTFFLDLRGYRRSKEIEEELTMRGATVEKFLDKSVRYIVTNRSKDDIKKMNHLRTTPSGQSPHTPSTGGLSQLMSPFSNQSSSSDKKTAKAPYYTRAQKILQMSLDKKQESSGTSDVLALAVSWNCKILHVDAVEKELKKLKPVVVSKGNGIKKAIDLGSVRKLRSPFLKIEDHSRQYCPIIYEPSLWPTPNSQCSPNSCPFDPPRPDGLSLPHDGKETKNRKEVEKRTGYCEPCSVRFDDLEMHLRSAKHSEYANNPKNFERLDKLISQCTNFHDFLTNFIEQESNAKPNNEKTPSPLKKDGLTLYPDRVSMVSLPSREGPLVIHSDYPVLDQSPGVCTRQMKRKLVGSSPSLPPSNRKRTRTVCF